MTLRAAWSLTAENGADHAHEYGKFTSNEDSLRPTLLTEKSTAIAGI